MLTNLDKKGVKWEIRKAGYLTVNVDGVIHWEHQQSGRVDDVTDELAIQAIIDNFSLINYEKRLKRKELKAEYVRRLVVVYPDADLLEEDIIDFVVDMSFDVFRSVIGSSRSPTTDWQNVMDIRAARRTARQAINALATIPEIQAYDVVNTPTWPV